MFLAVIHLFLKGENMTIFKPEFVVDDYVQVLGTSFITSYLVRGEKLALLEGGLASMWNLVKEQLAEIKVNPGEIEYLIMPHSHIDHVGMARPFKKEFPDIRITGTKEIAGTLTSEVYSDEMKRMDSAFENILNLKTPEEYLELLKEKIIVETALDDGESLDLKNGVTLEVIKTPGHSPCSSCIYTAGKKTMFVSDSSGLIMSDDKVKVLPMVFGNYKQPISSLEKLSGYDVENI